MNRRKHWVECEECGKDICLCDEDCEADESHADGLCGVCVKASVAEGEEP